MKNQNVSYLFKVIGITAFTLFVVFCFKENFFQKPIAATASQELLPTNEEIQIENDDFHFFQEDIESLSEEEAQIQEELFHLSRELEELYEEKSHLESDIDEIERALSRQRRQLRTQEEAYKSAQDDLGEIFQTLQRLGPVSYLEMLILAETWDEFIHRLDIVRHFVVDAKERMKTFIAEREHLSEQIAQLENTLKEKERLEKKVKDQIQSIEVKYEQQEEILTEIQEKRKEFEARMERIDENWQKARSDIVMTLNRTASLIEQGDFDMDDIEIRGSLFSPRVNIPENKFSDILEEDPELPDLRFNFQEGLIALYYPGNDLNLYLQAISETDTKIELVITRIEFVGFSLPDETIERLNHQVEIIFDFEELLAGYKIEALAFYEEYMELELTNGLFSQSLLFEEAFYNDSG